MNEKKEEIKAYIEKAKKFLNSAEVLLKEGDYDSSVSRIYYAMYYMAKSVLLSKSIEAKTHTGIINRFGKFFIKTKIFSKEIGKSLSNAFEKRLIGDYEIFKEIEKVEVKLFLKKGKKFVRVITEYLKNKGLLLD